MRMRAAAARAPAQCLQCGTWRHLSNAPITRCCTHALTQWVVVCRIKAGRDQHQVGLPLHHHRQHQHEPGGQVVTGRHRRRLDLANHTHSDASAATHHHRHQLRELMCATSLMRAAPASASAHTCTRRPRRSVTSGGLQATLMLRPRARPLPTWSAAPEPGWKPLRCAGTHASSGSARHSRQPRQQHGARQELRLHRRATHRMRSTCEALHSCGGPVLTCRSGAG